MIITVSDRTSGCSLCNNVVVEGNFVFWFAAQFNSTHQDDLSYSIQISFPGSRNWVSCQTRSPWLNNAVQCRRPTGRSSIAAAAWTHEGAYLIYGSLASIT